MPLKKKKRAVLGIGIVLVACLFFYGGSVFGEVSVPMQDTETAHKYAATETINSIRAHMGLPALSQSQELNEMAQSHSRYMENQHEVGYEELPGQEYYTGMYPLDRSLYYGYEGPYVTEYDNLRMATYEEYVAWCIQDPYQRTALLSPGCSDVGFGVESPYYCMAVGGSGYQGEALTAVYPYAGQQDVDTLTMAELTRTPEGLEFNAGQSIGLPVTVQYYQGDLTELSFQNVKASLTDTKRETDMEIVLVAPQDENAVWNTLILFPTQRYQPNTKYTVSVWFEVWHGETRIDIVDEKWSFTSAGPDYLGEVKRRSAIVSLADALRIPIELPETIDEKLLYSDISTADDEFSLLYKLREDGVLEEGFDEFEPNSFTTREQAVVWLMKLLEVYDPNVITAITLDYKDTFEDINQCSEEARDSVQLAYQLGLIEDQGGGIFNPQVFITTAEMDALVECIQQTIDIEWPEAAVQPAEN